MEGAVLPTGTEERAPGGYILVVDDDEDLLELMELVLAGAGYQTMSATNGREALDRLRAEMPTLILLDMRMPEMNGWEFARRYQATYEDEQTRAPIVVVSAAPDPARLAQEIHAQGSLPKPFSPSALVEKVTELVHQAI